MRSGLLSSVKLLTRKAGKTKDEDNVTGSINVPEVAHDTESDEYVVGNTPDVDARADTLAVRDRSPWRD